MSIIAAKSEKRKREHGKETQFFHGGAEIKREKLKTFKKRKCAEVTVVVDPRAGLSAIMNLRKKILTRPIDTPEGITYCTPAPETPQSSPTFLAAYNEHEHQENMYANQGTALTLENLANHGYDASEEDEEVTPSSSHNSRDRKMLIQSIPRKSMLMDYYGRGLHTMDEESVMGDEDEELTPQVVCDVIANNIREACIDQGNQRSRSAAIKYLGSIILAFERKCVPANAVLLFVSQFLDFLEAGPGACVVALQESLERPSFLTSQYSDVCRLYSEVLTRLSREYEPTFEVVPRACVLLANLESLYPEMTHHAETLYSVAIEGYEKLEKFDDVLQCQLSLADVLCELNRPLNAYELLSRGCGRYLRDHLDSWVAHLPIRALYNLTSLLSTGSVVRPSIFRIKRLLSRKAKVPKGSRENDYLYLMMLHEMGVLGGVLSMAASQSDSPFYLEGLDPLWSELFSKLSVLDDTNFALLKAFTHIQRSNYLCNSLDSKRHMNCFDDLRLAHSYLTKEGRHRSQLKADFVQHTKNLEVLIRGMSRENRRTLDMIDALSIARLADVSDSPSMLPVDSSSGVPIPPVGQGIRSSFEQIGSNWNYSIENNTWMRLSYGVRYSDESKTSLVFTD